MANSMVRVAIVGAGGRMGRQLIQAAQQQDGIQLGAAIEREGSSLIGTDAGELAGIGKLGIAIVDSLNVNDFDVVIDFTRPEGTLHYLAFCKANQKATGFDEQGKQAIAEAAKSIPIVFAANFSVGVNVVLKLLEKAAKVMGNYTDIEIVEAHHRHKVDAPSGTALAMGESIASALGKDLKSVRYIPVKVTPGNENLELLALQLSVLGILWVNIPQCLQILGSELKLAIKPLAV